MSDETHWDVPRDVLTMLRVELREAMAGRWELRPDSDGVDVDFVEMLRETIDEIERLREIVREASGEPTPPPGPGDT